MLLDLNNQLYTISAVMVDCTFLASDRVPAPDFLASLSICEVLSHSGQWWSIWPLPLPIICHHQYNWKKATTRSSGWICNEYSILGYDSLATTPSNLNSKLYNNISNFQLKIYQVHSYTLTEIWWEYVAQREFKLKWCTQQATSSETIVFK